MLASTFGGCVFWEWPTCWGRWPCICPWGRSGCRPWAPLKGQTWNAPLQITWSSLRCMHSWKCGVCRECALDFLNEQDHNVNKNAYFGWLCASCDDERFRISVSFKVRLMNSISNERARREPSNYKAIDNPTLKNSSDTRASNSSRSSIHTRKL